jgi:hypothetical protein
MMQNGFGTRGGIFENAKRRTGDKWAIGYGEAVQ